LELGPVQLRRIEYRSQLLNILNLKLPDGSYYFPDQAPWLRSRAFSIPGEYKGISSPMLITYQSKEYAVAGFSIRAIHNLFLWATIIFPEIHDGFHSNNVVGKLTFLSNTFTNEALSYRGIGRY
jgi:hypothetical protein